MRNVGKTPDAYWPRIYATRVHVRASEPRQHSIDVRQRTGTFGSRTALEIAPALFAGSTCACSGLACVDNTLADNNKTLVEGCAYQAGLQAWASTGNLTAARPIRSDFNVSRRPVPPYGAWKYDYVKPAKDCSGRR